MTFMDAVKEINAGKHVTRKSWLVGQWLFANDVWSFVNCSYEGYPLDYFEAWSPKPVDFLADDWIAMVPALTKDADKMKWLESQTVELIERVKALETRGTPDAR